MRGIYGHAGTLVGDKNKNKIKTTAALVAVSGNGLFPCQLGSNTNRTQSTRILHLPRRHPNVRSSQISSSGGTLTAISVSLSSLFGSPPNFPNQTAPVP